MSHRSKVRIEGAKVRSSTGLMVSGAASVNVYQRMLFSRKRVAVGSIASDWKAVGADVKLALSKVKRELESA